MHVFCLIHYIYCTFWHLRNQSAASVVRKFGFWYSIARSTMDVVGSFMMYFFRQVPLLVYRYHAIRLTSRQIIVRSFKSIAAQNVLDVMQTYFDTPQT